ncbi:MAG TPA: outer membrane protein assembly factor BamA [Chthoniobacterales bacterium]|jgi:outer membrane protein insertion porin family|nr:outer membrane protein assembly factor BamA [Chthoniobacterales bacterium]
MTDFRGSVWGWTVAAVFVAASATFAPQVTLGQAAQQPEAPLIRAIEVQYSGPATVSKEAILAQMRTSVGQPYSDTTVEEDIRNLYKTGTVQNVRIFAQPEGDGVKVIVAVQTRQVLRELVVDGAHRVSAKKLRKEIGVRLNAPVNEDDLQKARQKIIDTYQSKGFTDVSVDFKVEPIEESRGTARVIYTVEEGAKGAVSKIHFAGNEHFGERILRKQMKTKGKTMLSFVDKSGRLDEAQLQQDLDSVKEFYQNHGYVDVEVTEASRERRHGGPLVITVGIKEGAQYHVNKLTFAGYKLTDEQKLRKTIKLKEGDVYSPKQLHDDAKAIADGYGSGGYVDLVILPQGTPAGPGLIDVHYKIEEGNRSFVERINIVGNSRTKDKVIRREVLIAPGDVFNTVRVETTKKRLENLGYFSKVETFPEETGVEGRKDLVVQVEEKRTGSLNFGAGYSTIDSVIGFVELTQSNFDITNWPSMTGGGQRFRAKAQIGSQRKDFNVSLTEPYFLNRRFSLSGSAFYSEANYLSSVYDQRNYGASLEARKPIWSWIYGVLGYSIQNFEIYNVATDASPEIQAQGGTTSQSMVTGSLVWDRRDNPFLTRKGERISLASYVAGGPLGGDVQIYGFDFQATKYIRVWKDIILLGDAEVSTVDVWDKPETKLFEASGDVTATGVPKGVVERFVQEVPSVPIFDRLYLGGSNNLRGFRFRDIGPRDSRNQPIGGQSLVRATVEVSFPIIEKARGAFFYDCGFVNPDPWNFTPDTIAVPRGNTAIANAIFLGAPNPFPNAPPGVSPRRTFDSFASDYGVGLRLDLPIGPLRLDYGFPLDTAGNGKHGHLNFSVGYQF